MTPILSSGFTHGGRRKHVHPGVFQTLQEQWQLSNPSDHLHVYSLFARINWKISRGKHWELLWWSGVSKCYWNTWLHFLLVSRSLLYIDASPTSLFFNPGPRVPVSSCVRSSQSSMSSSYLNHEVDPSKSGGIFTPIPMDADERFEKLWTPVKSSS